MRQRFFQTVSPSKGAQPIEPAMPDDTVILRRLQQAGKRIDDQETQIAVQDKHIAALHAKIDAREHERVQEERNRLI